MVEFMLAHRGEGNPVTFLNNNGSEYIVEEKRDGIRALLRYDRASIRLTNRSGADITGLCPDLTRVALPQLQASSVDEFILDGELVCRVNNRDDIAEVMRKNSPNLKQFIAFDALSYQGRDLRQNPQHSRTTAAYNLTQMINCLAVRPIMPVNNIAGYMQRPDVEGVVIKNANAPYIPGRQKYWLKYKRIESETFIVAGLEPGHGERAKTFGALHLVDPATMKYAGKVGSGFSQTDLETLVRRWRAFESGVDPNPVLVEVEFDARSRADGGVLRFPVFKHVREDLQMSLTGTT